MLTFMANLPRVNDYGVVSFDAQNEDVALVCSIDAAVLEQRFAARSHQPEDLLEAFLANRRRIEAIAAKKIPLRLAQGLRPHLRISDF